MTAVNSASHTSKRANTTPNASTVPRSLTKQAARMTFPISVRLNPVSTMTA